MYSVFVLLLLLHCFIFILVLLLCCVSRSSLYCNIPSDLCTLCLSCYYTLFYLYLVLLLCYVSRSSLYCNIPSDLCTLCLSCYYFYIVLSLYLYCCYVMYPDHHFTVIYLQTCVVCVCLVITSTLFYLYLYIIQIILPLSLQLCMFVLLSSTDHLLLCYVSRSSLYCNIPSDLCTLCLSCYYFYIVLSLYLYCCYVVYLDHHFTVIYLQTCVLCVCLVITSTLFYLYTCTVVMLCI